MQIITKSLREIVKYISKGIVPVYADSEDEQVVKVLNQKCNRGFSIYYDKARFHNLAKKNVPKDRILQKNDVLINSTGVGTAGRVAQIIKIDCPVTFDGHMILLRPASVIDPLFFGYAIKDQQAMIESLAEGTTGQTEINRQRLLNEIIITFPKNVSDQQKIARILRALDDKIELNTRINQNLEEQAKAIFKSYYQKAQQAVSFTSVIDVLGGGTPKTTEPNFWNGTIPFFTPKDARETYCFATEKNITERGLNHCNSRLYPKNTTLLTARGTVGKISLAGKPMAMNQSCYALMSKVIDPLLVYLYTLQTVDKLKHKASGAVFDTIVTRDFTRENIFLIAKEESNELVKKIEPLYGLIHLNIGENKKLVTLRDTLLPKLMSGEIDVSEIDL